MDWEKFGAHVFAAIVYVTIGLAFFAASFWIVARVAPFSVRKEIEDDQNSALAIIFGAMIIGVSIIIAAAIHGG